MTTALLVLGGLTLLIAALVGVEYLTRWWERHHGHTADPEVHAAYRQDRSELARRAWQEHDGRAIKGGG